MYAKASMNDLYTQMSCMMSYATHDEYLGTQRPME